MSDSPTQFPLEGTVWHLVSIADDDGLLSDPTPGSRATLQIEGDRIAGNASCNRFFCDGALDSIPDVVGLTMMMCPEPVMAQERRYLDHLTRISSWTIAEHRLTASDASGTRILVWSAEGVSREERGDPRAE